MADKDLTIRVNVAGGSAAGQVIQYITNNITNINTVVKHTTNTFQRFGNVVRTTINSIGRIGISVFSSLRNALSGVVFQVLALAAAYGGLRAIMGAVAGQGMLEDQVRSVAAMIAMTTGDFKRAMIAAKGYVSDLVEDAKKLPGEFSDFMAVTQSIAGPMMTIGKSLADIRKTTGQIAIASSIFGLRIEQTGTDIMRMMQGSAGLEQVFWRTLKAMNLITLSSEKFNKLAPVERYNQVSRALARIAGDQTLLASVAASWSTQTSTLKDNISGVQGIMGKIGAILMAQILPRVARVNEWFEKNEATVDRIASVIGGVLSDAIIKLEAPAKAIFQTFVGLVDYLGQHRDEVRAFMDDLLPSKETIVNTFETIAKGAIIATITVANLIKGLKLIGEEINATASKVNVFVTAHGGIGSAGVGMFFQPVWKTFAELRGYTSGEMKALEAQLSGLQETLARLKNSSDTSGNRVIEIDRVNQAIAETAMRLQELRHASDTATDTSNEFVATWANSAASALDYSDALKGISSAFSSVRSEVSKFQATQVAGASDSGESSALLGMIPSSEQVASGFASLSASVKSGMDKATGYIKQGWTVAASETGKAMERMRTAVVEAQLAIAQEIQKVNEDSWNARLGKTSEGLATLRDMEINRMAERLEELGMTKDMELGFLEWKNNKYAEYSEKIKAMQKEEAKAIYDEERANHAIGFWNRLRREIELTQTRIQDFGVGLKQGLAEWTDAMLDMKARGIDAVKSALDAFSDGATDAFMSIIDGSKSAAEAFKDFARQLIVMLIRTAIQLLITTILAIALRAALGDPTAGMTASNAASGGAAAIGGITAGVGAGGSATGMDSGGVIRGPANIRQGNITEAHIPIPSGRVPVEIRNGGGVGNGPIAVNITINNPKDGADVQRVIASPEFGRAVKAHTIANLSTSGRTRSAARSAASGRA